MEATGKISPDSRTCGSEIMNASWMAWPWFCETVEISTPMPRVTSRNSAAPRAKTATLPANGTWKTPMPIDHDEHEVDRGHDQVRRDLARDDVPGAERHDRELFQRARLPLPDDARGW